MGGLEETLRAFLRPDLGTVVGGLIISCCFYSALNYRGKPELLWIYAACCSICTALI